MKTGMEWPLLGLVVIVALGMLWIIYSGMQVDIAVATTSAAAAGRAVPAPVMIGGQWVVNAIIGTLIGAAVSAFIAGLVVWVRRRWSEMGTEQKWRSGPNANWGRVERQPKTMSEGELYRLMLMQQMGLVKPGPSRPTLTGTEDDEPKINL